MKRVNVDTPIAKDDPDQVQVETIPLPPEELWPELDNSGPAAPQAPATPVRAPSPKPEIAKLDFVTAGRTVTIELEHPFHFEGDLVETITVRRLLVGEVGELVDSMPKDRVDNFEIYGAMTGLPAPVLRGLVDVDGERVVAAAYDFLPRLFRPAAAASSST